jgi:ACP-SH:acetate ligase
VSDILRNLENMVNDFGTAPTLEMVERRTLADKGIAGATAAHVIEEIHTPYNLAFVSFTTGSTAFQNIVGVTHAELPDRIDASLKAFSMAGVAQGSHALVTYAPLVNVFPVAALKRYGLTWNFPRRSSRDAFLLSLCLDKPSLVVGESSFIRASLADALSLGLINEIPRGVIVFTAGTTLDLELLPVAERYGWQVHDIYGCQEFGWLTLDGIPLRNDISLIPSPQQAPYRELVVGGLPMADSFPVSVSGHVCHVSQRPAGEIITYRRHRTHPEYEVYVAATTLNSAETAGRVARTILRIKGRVVKVRPDVRVSAPATVLELVSSVAEHDRRPDVTAIITGPEKTCMFDLMVQAQLNLQQTSKTDPTWNKVR